MPIYVERVIIAIADLRAFDQRDAERLAEELLALRRDRSAVSDHLAQRLKGYVKRENVVIALKEVL